MHNLTLNYVNLRVLSENCFYFLNILIPKQLFVKSQTNQACFGLLRDSSQKVQVHGGLFCVPRTFGELRQNL